MPRPIKYGVLYPTYGIKIRYCIQNLLKKEQIKLICLRKDDFHNQLRLTDNYDTDWLGYAVGRDKHIVLNATKLYNNHCQADVDHIILHEIAHIQHPHAGEIAVEAAAAKLAKRLKLDIIGKVILKTK